MRSELNLYLCVLRNSKIYIFDIDYLIIRSSATLFDIELEKLKETKTATL